VPAQHLAEGRFVPFERLDERKPNRSSYRGRSGNYAKSSCDSDLPPPQQRNENYDLPEIANGVSQNRESRPQNDKEVSTNKILQLVCENARR
jgi:hypothetical protein